MQEELLNELFLVEDDHEVKDNLNTYVIIDAAQIDELTNELAILSESQYAILFEGKDAIKLEEVAPYLVELKKEDSFTEWVVKEVYGKNGAIFLKSTQKLESLAEHLKSFIPVTREVEYQGKEITQKGYLAYYDPRVFYEWIQSVDNTQQENFFSYLEKVYHEDMFNKTTLWSSSYHQELQQKSRELI